MKPTVIAAVMLAAAIYLSARSEPQTGPAKVEQKGQTETRTDRQQPTSAQNEERPTATPKNKPPHWYESPEWVLVIVGIVTCGVIWYQSWATLRAARATENSVALQRIAQQPWVDIGNWALSEEESGDSMTVHCSFDVINSTNIPVALQRVQTTVRRMQSPGATHREPCDFREENFEVTDNTVVPPISSNNRNSYTCLIEITLRGDEIASYWNRDFWVCITGRIFMLDADGREKPQHFQQLAVLGPKKIELWRPAGAVPERRENSGAS